MMDAQGHSLLLRIVSAVVFRLPGRPAAKMAEFSHTEYGSGLDMLGAVQGCADPVLKRQYYQHALDELQHARLFRTRARELAPSGSRAFTVAEDSARVHDQGIRTKDPLYSQLDETEFLAFVWVHERDGARQFQLYSELMADDPESVTMFARIAKDERFHIAYSRAELDRRAAEGQDRDVKAAVWRVKLRALKQLWLRFGRNLGNLMANLWLGLLYVLVMGPFALAARAREGSPGGLIAVTEGPEIARGLATEQG